MSRRTHHLVAAIALLAADCCSLRLPASLRTGTHLARHHHQRWRGPAMMVKGDTTGRGFGAQASPPPSPVSSKKRSKSTAAAAPSAADSPSLEDGNLAAEARGRQMLEQMRESAGSTVDPFSPLKKTATLTPAELEPLDPEAGVMPTEVSDRMLRRVVPFAGVPIVGGVLVFVGFWYANTQLQMDLPPTIVAYATQAMLVLSFAGITWGVMSTSWDEDAEQSLLGTENVMRNVNLMRGAEEERIAGAKEFAELQDAAKEGIIMNSAAAAKRAKEAAQREANQ